MLGIVINGIVRVPDGGEAQIVRPGKNGGVPAVIHVPEELAERYRLVTGDIVEGDVRESAVVDFRSMGNLPDVDEEVDFQYDEPIGRLPSPPPELERTLVSVSRINGIHEGDALDRPYSKSRRSQSERTRPDRRIQMARAEDDTLGRFLDFAAPLGCGDFGVIIGPHNSGRTRTVRAVLQGIAANAPDCVVILLAIQSRSEEITDLRRLFPDIDVVVCPMPSYEVSREAALLIPTLVLEAAQRQTELGKDVVLAIDSLTALWAIMLEMEEATDQRGADTSNARRLIRDFVQKAGCFHGETPLGGSLGGSLTIIGAVWDQPVDEDAEEERESHPHLRLIEAIMPDLSWRITLDARLAQDRLYPAIDIGKCVSNSEDALISADQLEPLLRARGALPRRDALASYTRLMDALEATTTAECVYNTLSQSG